VYLKEKTKRIFEVDEINEKEKSLKLKNSFEMDKSLPPTAIIAIKERECVLSTISTKSLFVK
jgi:hypothetical protein